MKALEDFRNNQMMRIKSKLVPATIYYSSKAKTYKQQIGKYKDKIKENEKQRQEMDKAKMSRNELKQSQLSNDIKKSRREIENVGETLQSNVMKFEADRVIDNKYIILHYIHCELAYHAKSLEKLSDLYKTIKYLEPKKYLREFADKLKFQSVNLEEFGYDEREYTKKSINPNNSIKVSQSNKKSLKVSGLGESKRSGMLKKSNYEEVKKNLPKVIGLREFFDYFDGLITLDTAIEEAKQVSRRYAKRQLTWFRNRFISFETI